MGQAEEYLDRIPMDQEKNSLEDVRRFLDYLGNPTGTDRRFMWQGPMERVLCAHFSPLF